MQTLSEYFQTVPNHMLHMLAHPKKYYTLHNIINIRCKVCRIQRTPVKSISIQPQSTNILRLAKMHK